MSNDGDFNVELKNLVGAHTLTGVDFSSERIPEYEGGPMEDAEVINFTLDGTTFTAAEDPEDGYRSMMRYLRLSKEPTKNVFVPVRVVGRMKDDDEYQKNYVIEFIDCITGKVVLEVGTENYDDYYPCWVARFSPENMVLNVAKQGGVA